MSSLPEWECYDSHHGGAGVCVWVCVGVGGRWAQAGVYVEGGGGGHKGNVCTLAYHHDVTLLITVVV